MLKSTAQKQSQNLLLVKKNVSLIEKRQAETGITTGNRSTTQCNLPKSPTGRLGIIQASLQKRLRMVMMPIPQPARLGIFHASLQKRLRMATLPNPPTGRLGIFHASLHKGRRMVMMPIPPTGQVGDHRHPQPLVYAGVK